MADTKSPSIFVTLATAGVVGISVVGGNAIINPSGEPCHCEQRRKEREEQQKMADAELMTSPAYSVARTLSSETESYAKGNFCKKYAHLFLFAGMENGRAIITRRQGMNAEYLALLRQEFASVLPAKADHPH